jgi:CheY-like chemotaxis protein
VQLPLALETTREEPPRMEPATLNLSGQAILVVDDNHDAADSLAALLSMYGADVEVVYNGADALRSVARRAPSLLFVDIGMPSMNGFEVARRIRGTPAGAALPLVALTGWGQDHDRQAAFAAGFNHHMTKPPDSARLEALLASIAESGSS